MAGKDLEVKARVTKQTRAALDQIADAKGESLSLVIREAIGEYLSKRNEAAPGAGTQKKVNYLKDRRRSGTK